MALWINAIFGYPARVELDLLAILHGDMGLGDAPVITDPTVFQMTYAPTTAGFAQSRLNTVINTAFQNQIVVTGVDSTYGFMNGPFWQSITKVGGGVTVVRKTGSVCTGATPNYNTENIQVVYDVSECGGSGYWVRDGANNKVVEPPAVALFHELSHAFHWANRSAQYCATGEQQAVDDENSFRTQLGLPKRSFQNLQGGCGAPSPYNPWEGIGCFIVSAVTGSPRSMQVLEFHRIRDALLRPTRLGRNVFASLFAEYYQCAPRIVADMKQDSSLKSGVTRMVVEPLLDFLQLAEAHARRDLRSGELDETLAAVFERSRGRLPEVGAEADALAGLAIQAAALERSMARPAGMKNAMPAVEGAVDAVFRYLDGAVQSSAAGTRALAWGVAQPLALYFDALARYVAGTETLPVLRDALADAIEIWLASAPVDWQEAGLDAEALAKDLQALAASVMTSPSMRRRFAGRWQCSAAAPPGVLAPALVAAGFLDAQALDGAHGGDHA